MGYNNNNIGIKINNNNNIGIKQLARVSQGVWTALQGCSYGQSRLHVYSSHWLVETIQAVATFPDYLGEILPSQECKREGN